MENLCSKCGNYKTLPLFWSGTAEPLVCNCPKENLDFYKQGFSDAIKLQTQISYSEKEIFEIINNFCFDWNYNYKGELSQKEYLKEWFENFKSKSDIKKETNKFTEENVRQAWLDSERNMRATFSSSAYKEMAFEQWLQTLITNSL